MRKKLMIMALAVPATMASALPASADTNFCHFATSGAVAGEVWSCSYTSALAVGGIALSVEDGAVSIDFSCGGFVVKFDAVAGSAYTTGFERVGGAVCTISGTAKVADTVFSATAT